MSTPKFDLTAAVAIAARTHYIVDHIDVDCFDAGLAWDDMGGSEPSDERALLEIAMRGAIVAALPHLLAQISEGIAVAILAQGTYRSQWGAVRGITAFTATDQDAQIARNFGDTK